MRIFFTFFISWFIAISALADESDYWFLNEPTPKPKKKVVNEQPLIGEDGLINFNNEILDDSRPIVMLKPGPSQKRTYKKVDARRLGPSIDSITASYQKLGIDSIWTGVFGGLNAKGKEFLEYVKTVNRHGFKPSEYHLGEISQAVENGEDVDKLISRAFVKLANHATLGRLIPKKADTDWFITQNSITQNQLIKSATSASDIGAYIESLFPQTRLYQNLVRAYQNIEQLVKDGGWSEFPTAGPKLQQGSSHKHVPLLRQRLHDSGYLDGASGGTTFDDKLKQALVRFQEDHGLNTDGVLGRITRLTLAKSVEQRKKQITNTLERLRWLPNNLGSRYIMVNTAGYELNMLENEYTAVNMRIVVGKKKRGGNNHETPSFFKNMQYLVLNPRWYVPPSIASKELLLLAQKDRNFFKKKGYKVYSSKGEVNSSSVNWHKYRKGEKLPLQIVQKAGSGNALGRIKFMLPNKFNIYLHDTPQKSLFARDRRAFSHGCVRLAKPMSLATKVLGKSEEEISSMISSGRNQRVDLAQNIPVYIVYLTAWVRDDGRVIFFDDYYGRDARMQHNFS